MSVLKIAVVNDDKVFAAQIDEFLRFYEQTACLAFAVDTYNSGAVFLSNKEAYDIIFIRVELSGMDGFGIAERIRSFDRNVNIVFTADSPKDAIRGYDYEAIGYLVAPTEYLQVSDILDKAIKRLHDLSDNHVIIKTSKAYEKVRASDILYVKKQRNYIVYTTLDGDLSERGSLELALAKLRDRGFVQCNSGCLINIRAVQKVVGDCVTVGDAVLPVSRSRKPEIRSALKDLLL